MSMPADHLSHSSPASTLVAGMVDLVPLPQAYVRIRQAVEDPDSDLREIAEIVNSDPALAARLLRLVNSAYVGLVAPVETIDHAVRVLGMHQIHDMALATSAVGSLSQLRGELFNLFEFWQTSVLCAAGARELASRQMLPNPERMFIAGLLHNVGNLVIAHELPESWRECANKARAANRPYYELQRELLGYDYAEVSAELLRHWHLSAGLIVPIYLHTQAIANIDAEERAIVAALSVASTTARTLAWTDGDSEPPPQFDADALQQCNIDEDELDALIVGIQDSVADSLAVLLPDHG